jgi:hypothetical protein
VKVAPIILLGIAIIAYQIYVTIAAVRFPRFAGAQKAILVAVIWLIPLFGAVIAHVMIYLTAKRGQ